MNPLHWSSLGTANCTTVTGRTFINPNLDTHHPHRHDGAAIATPLPYGYNTDSDIEHQHFYPASPTTVPGLTQSDALRFPKPPRQFNTEPNYYTTASTSSSTTNVGRFSAGSPPPSVPSSSEVRARFNHPTSYDIDHGATSHLAFKLPDYSSYRFPSPDSFSVGASATRGLTESGRYSPKQFISRNDSSNQTQAHAGSWGPDMSMPFLDQATTASVTRGAQTTYQWIDPVISDSPEQVSLALASSSGGKGSYLPPSSHKSRLGTSSVTAHQITHHSPVISPSLDNLSRPQSNMTIQTRLSSTSMSTSASTSQLNNSGSGPVPITPAAVTTALASNEPVQVQAQADQDNPKPRKKHGCPMCHKSFDRPSTLRKHLLVHTGEKAFVCDICGRRFGVNSNLNRHVKRCILRNPADASSSAAPPGAEPSIQGGGPPTTSVPVAGLSNTSATPGPSQKHPLHPSAIATGKRKATSSPASSLSSSSARTPTQSHAQTVGSTKRRRRPPSPTQWIPASLAFFKLLPIEVTKCASVPLPPVSPVRDPRTNELIEERDSWDENVGPAPYYKDWTGRLPGPAVGFGGKDVGNLGFPLGGEGYVMGRLVLS